MDLLKLISPDICLVPLEAIDRREAINAMVCHLAEVGLVENPSAITEVVWEREMQRTTGIGEGLAVPHGRCPTIDKLVIAMGIPSEPVDFQSYDRKPVQFIVLVLSPPDAITDHIQVLGAISRLMSDPGFRKAAVNAESADELSGHFCEALANA